MLKLIHAALVLVTIAFTSGCTITQKVSPVGSAPAISTIYIQRNPNIHMAGLHPELVQQLTTLGFQVETFDSVRPGEATYWMTYTANWAWDMAMYLTYFDAMLMEEGRIIGRAQYDARGGGGNMGKFGKTAEKIRPLLIELLQNVKRGPSSAAPLGADKPDKMPGGSEAAGTSATEPSQAPAPSATPVQL